MSSVTLEKFSTELRMINDHFDELEPISFYVAGVAKQKLGFLDLNVILDFLVVVVRAFNNQEISIEQRIEIERKIYDGRLGEAKNYLDGCKDWAQPIPLRRFGSSQVDYFKAQLLMSSFSEVEEVDGQIFYRNPSTGEVISEEQAALLNKPDSEQIGKLLESQKAEAKRLEEDEQLAKRLQEQFDIEDRPVEPLEAVDCKICLEQIPAEDYMPLEGCGHLFHMRCVSQYMSSQIDGRQFPLRCPLTECKHEIDMLDISERLEPEMLAKFEEYSFNYFVSMNMAFMTCCPTPDCSYVFSPESEVSHFRCPRCLKEYCLKCKCDFHHGFTCEQYAKSKADEPLDKAFMEFVQGAKYKQCARCKFWVEKSEGCDHMTCRCHYQFCYACGGVYPNCECKKAPIIPRPIPRNPQRVMRRPYRRPGFAREKYIGLEGFD